MDLSILQQLIQFLSVLVIFSLASFLLFPDFYDFHVTYNPICSASL
jgi:hypothetical protein